MNSSLLSSLPDLSRLIEPWRARLRTAEAMIALRRARRLVHGQPFGSWRGSLGDPAPPSGPGPGEQEIALAWALARHVDRAAWRLGGEWLCLPRAIALAAMLRRRGIGYGLHIAARPEAARTGSDDLHAWIDVGPVRVLGDLPGEWAVVYLLYG